MILILLLIGGFIRPSVSNKMGIGLGAYPNGLLSLKYRPNPEFSMQLTIGISPYQRYHADWERTITAGGRWIFKIKEGSWKYKRHKYIHWGGTGAGMHIYTSKETLGSSLMGEFFYEFEFFPNPQESPFSLGIGAGLLGEIDWTIFCVFPSIHFYFK